MSGLPRVLAEIATVAGRQAAMDLALAMGGKRLHVPKRAHLCANHSLVEAVGMDAAISIARRFEGEGIYVPHCRRAVARYLASQGASNREIAERLGVSLRAAQQYRQANMFA